MTSTTDDTDWVSPQQAAVLLGLSPKTVHYHADRGHLEAKRTPLGRLINRASVEQLLEQRAARL